MTQPLLTLLSAGIWWIIYSSAAAVLPAVMIWAILRWLERTPVVFNRAYFASLLWALSVVALGGLVIAVQHGQAAGQSVFALPWMRAALVLGMLLGAFFVWRLVPRVDARRVKPTSACMAVAMVMVVVMVLGTTLHR